MEERLGTKTRPKPWMGWDQGARMKQEGKEGETSQSSPPFLHVVFIPTVKWVKEQCGIRRSACHVGHTVHAVLKVLLFFFKDLRAHAHMGSRVGVYDAEGEGEEGSRAVCTPSAEHDLGSISDLPLRPWPELKSCIRCLTHGATQAPWRCSFFSKTFS